MATYFHNAAGSTSSEIQSSVAADHGLQTLYLMNPNNYVPNYSQDAAHHPMPNMLLFNPTNALNLVNLSHAPPQHMINNGVTVNPTSNFLRSPNPDDPTFLRQHDHISGFHGFTATAAPPVHYNLWRSVIDQTPPAVVETPPNTCGGGDDVSPQMSNFQRPPQQGLSLSLSSQQQTVYNNRPLYGGDLEVAAMSPISRVGGNDIRSIIVGSKYLKAAQGLLDEVVNVVGGEGIYKCDEYSIEGANKKKKIKVNTESTCGNHGDSSSGGEGENSATKQGVELGTAQRQELRMKKSKLVSMLDEVEQRYRQYHHQTQIVISSFEEVASFGAAKSYTALALKTISKQFRCLKDAISSQIRETSKSLGEDHHCLGAKVEGSRLRFVDHHLRQQRVLEQLGMMQQNAWRPQRGLPERAVSVLRAWLFEHFLHPYPKDSDKVMLAKQTGLTRSQVSNWFINARVRLWKPMVEEMYSEEMKEQEQNNDGSSKEPWSKGDELWSAANNNNTSMESGGGVIRLDQIKVVQSSEPETSLINNPQKASPTLLEISNSSLSKPSLQSQSSTVLSVDMEMKPGETSTTRNIKFEVERLNNHGAFSLEEIGRFNVTNGEQLAPRFHGNGVSLSLGLPHTQSENLINPLSTGTGAQHGFLSRNNVHLGMRLEMGANINGNDRLFCAINTTTPPPSSSHSSTSYESSIDFQNRKRFCCLTTDHKYISSQHI